MTTPGSGPSGPLAGVRVVEIASYVTGPYAASLLADLGASVIKVEERVQGDPFRNWGQGGYSATFRGVNHSKRSLALDLRCDAARAIVLGVLDTADVFIQNFRPGVVERMGVGWEVASARNPRLVYCSISGFGDGGPYRDLAGYDTVGQAMSGLLGLLTDADAPRPMGMSLSDHLTGLIACYGILGALLGRERSGVGQHVATSLLEATTSFLAEITARYLEDGKVPNRETRAHAAQAYAVVAGDALPLVVHLSSPTKFWEALTSALGREELRQDPRFATRQARIKHYQDLNDILVAVLKTGPRQDWLKRLQDAGVPCAPINSLDEVFADEQVEWLGMVQEVVHPTQGSMRLIGNGVRLDGQQPLVLAPPLLGEHTDEILAELGYADREIQQLRDQQVVT
jgi:crotonobetainyl-CoA:carnitine CoA-transferase CaiB-like acyl-CoA transferase